MRVRSLISDVLELLGVVVIAAVLWVEVGWLWALIPVSVFLIVFGVMLGRGGR